METDAHDAEIERFKQEYLEGLSRKQVSHVPTAALQDKAHSSSPKVYWSATLERLHGKH